MTRETRELLERVLQLPIVERAALAARLIESLGVQQTVDDSVEVARAWREELLRRYEDMATGRDPGVAVDDALSELRRAMAEERSKLS